MSKKVSRSALKIILLPIVLLGACGQEKRLDGSWGEAQFPQYLRARILKNGTRENMVVQLENHTDSDIILEVSSMALEVFDDRGLIVDELESTVSDSVEGGVIAVILKAGIISTDESTAKIRLQRIRSMSGVPAAIKYRANTASNDKCELSCSWIFPEKMDGTSWVEIHQGINERRP